MAAVASADPASAERGSGWAPCSPTGGRGYADGLMHGYQPAMIVMGALCVAAALTQEVTS
jgi:hypothetical protein